MAPEPKGMRAIDLDFMQDNIKAMPLTEEGKFRTIMFSEDYCKRVLVSGLSPFAIVETPQESVLILTDSSSYYHARIFVTSFDHYKFIAIISTDVNEINILLKKLEKSNVAILLQDKIYDHPLLEKGNNLCSRQITNGNIKAETSLYAVKLEYTNNFLNLVWNNNQDIDIETFLKFNGLDGKTINLADKYDQPITSISANGPGIQL
jgi:hypothetical protein